MIGAGGVIPPEDGYFAGLQQLCRQFDVLLIADEVITGFGRTGAWWGSQRYGIEPDLITFAKGVTSGYVPLGGVIAGSRVRAPFWDDPVPGAIFRHGYTYSGHAAACAAGLANLEILEREDLVARVRTLEPVLETGARGARLVGARRGGPDRRPHGCRRALGRRPGREPGAVEAVVAAARRNGILTRSIRGVAIQISPAFVITEDEIAILAEGLGAALDEVAA